MIFRRKKEPTQQDWERERLVSAADQIERITVCMGAAHKAGDEEHVERLVKLRRHYRDLVLEHRRRLRELNSGVSDRQFPWEPKSA